MAVSETFVVVGAGHAGGRAVEAMRRAGFDGNIVLAGTESHLPYERPPLSKEVLAKDKDLGFCLTNSKDWYADNKIEVMLGDPVRALDLGRRLIVLDGGREVAYSRLLLATGARVRRLTLAGDDLAGVHYLRSIDEALALRRDLREGAKIVVVGGGFIGLEVAASARGHGCAVTVLESMPALLGRMAAPGIAKFVEELHRRNGVDVRTGVSVTALEGGAGVERVVLADGEALQADAVVVGIGVVPNVELAEAAGIETDNGILVDEFCRTSDRHVYAAGDVTNHYNPLFGKRMRLESWQNAQNQAIAAAKVMCGGGEAFAEVPWLWSDQFDLNLQIAGLATDSDETISREGEDGFIKFLRAGGRLLGAIAVNQSRDMRAARILIAKRPDVPAADLADATIPLRKLIG